MLGSYLPHAFWLPFLIAVSAVPEGHAGRKTQRRQHRGALTERASADIWLPHAFLDKLATGPCLGGGR